MTLTMPSTPSDNSAPRKVELHAHTTASDGTLSPVELVSAASQQGVSVLAITDHDTIAGVADAKRTGEEAGMTIVPGVELSTTVEHGEVHILGYYVPVDDSGFLGELATFAQERRERITTMVQKLHALGYPVDLDAILVNAERGSVGRPHVGRALIDIGAVETMSEAFDRFLSPGRPAWVPRHRFPPTQAVSFLREHRAIPCLAHPFTAGDERAMRSLVAALRDYGLQAMEVDYAEYGPENRAVLRGIANDYDLIPLGGSDFHGPGVREGRILGSSNLPLAAWDRLRELGS